MTRAPVSIDPLQLPKVLIAGVKSATTYCGDDESNEHGAWRRGIGRRTLWPQSVVL